MRLPELGVRRPVAAMMVFCVVLLLGVVSALRLPIDLMPEIENPTITVITTWSGAGTVDVENMITRVIENALSSVNQLDELTSVTREGVSSVSCRFRWGTDLDAASNDVRDLLDRAKRRLPDDIDDPILFKFNTANMPVIFYGVTARESADRLEQIIDDLLADPLRRLPGVGGVNRWGGLRRQIHIHLDPVRLAAYDLTPRAIGLAVAEENLTLPAGNLQVGAIDYTIRIPGEFTDPEQIGDIVVKAAESRLVRLRDVARIEDGFEEILRPVEIMGRDGLMFGVQKRSGENTVDVCRRVREEMERLVRDLPEDCEVVLVGDSSEFIVNAIRNVTRAVLWGGVFVIVTTLFFLRSLRASWIIALTIPFSLILAFVFMDGMGWTLNLMSMASLSIAIGMVVDNAVVILENVSRHLEKGSKRREASMFGAEEVGLAIVASTLTTVVVFLPMVFLTGITGILFQQLAGLIAATLLASLFCSLYLTPMLCSKLLVVAAPPEARDPRPERLGGRLHRRSERWFERVEDGYAGLLERALRHRGLVVLLAVGGFALSLWGARSIGTEFMPEEDSGDLTVTILLPVGTRVERTADVCRRAIEVARQVAGPEHLLVHSFRAGTTRGAFGSSEGTHSGSLRLRLSPASQRDRSTQEIGREIAARIRAWPEVDRVFSRTGNFMSRILRGGGASLAIEVYGHDLDMTDGVARRIAELAEEVPGVRDPIVNRDIGQPELTVRIDREKALVQGVGVATIAEAMRVFFEGRVASRFRQLDDEFDILMRLEAPFRQSVEDLRRSEITTAAGRRIRLDEVADIREERGPVQIERKNQERVVTVEFDTIGRSQGEVVADLRERIEGEVSLPYGVTLRFGGLAEEQADSFRLLGQLLLLGVVLVYMVLAGQFESFRHPFLILFAMPFAFVGVVIALQLTGMALSVMSFIGGILLVGIVVNNAIVLIDRINLLRERDMPLAEAIREAGRSRLRPVLITTCTTLLGMMPLAVGGGDGSETWRPLAVTVIGGLSVSTIITLVFVPVLYHLSESLRLRRPRAGVRS